MLVPHQDPHVSLQCMLPPCWHRHGRCHQRGMGSVEADVDLRLRNVRQDVGHLWLRPCRLRRCSPLEAVRHSTDHLQRHIGGSVRRDRQSGTGQFQPSDG